MLVSAPHEYLIWLVLNQIRRTTGREREIERENPNTTHHKHEFKLKNWFKPNPTPYALNVFIQGKKSEFYSSYRIEIEIGQLNCFIFCPDLYVYLYVCMCRNTNNEWKKNLRKLGQNWVKEQKIPLIRCVWILLKWKRKWKLNFEICLFDPISLMWFKCNYSCIYLHDFSPSFVLWFRFFFSCCNLKIILCAIITGLEHLRLRNTF